MKDIIKLQILGDVCFNKIDREDCDKLLEHLKQELGHSDLRICNLECPIVDIENLKPIEKTGPNLYSDESMLDFLKCLETDIVTLANNHIGDYGENGIRDTIKKLNENGIFYIGTGENIDAAYESVRVETSGIKLSIISVCENEFGVATSDKAGVAGYSVTRMADKIREEKLVSDHVVVVFHGGNEFNPLPSPGVKERYHFLIDMGASAVIGMHTHCPQGYEYYKEGIIVYSLGNLYFPNNRYKNPYSTWYLGYVAQLQVSKTDIDFKTVPYRYSGLRKQIVPLERGDIARFQVYLKILNKIIDDDKELQRYFKSWSRHRGREYALRLVWDEEKFDTKRLLRQNVEIQNLFRCEAHSELMKTYFEIIFEEEEEGIWQDLKKLFDIPLVEDDWENELAVFYSNISITNLEQIKQFIEDSPVYICGAGQAGITVYRFLRQAGVKIEKFLENDIAKEGSYVCGTEIDVYDCLNKELDSHKKFVVAVINRCTQETITRQLKEYGVLTENITVCEG